MISEDLFHSQKQKPEKAGTHTSGKHTIIWLLGKASRVFGLSLLVHGFLSASIITTSASTDEDNATITQQKHGDLPVSVVVFLMMLSTSTFVLPLQRPWNSPTTATLGNEQDDHKTKGGRLNLDMKTAIRILLCSAWLCLTLVLWCHGLKSLGTARSIIVEYAEYILYLVLGVVLGWKKVPTISKRGCLFFTLAILFILLSSSPAAPVTVVKNLQQKVEGEGPETNETTTSSSSPSFGYNLWGCVAIIFACVLSMLRKNYARKLASEVGGIKQLFALTAAASTVIMLPLLFINLAFGTGIGSEVFSFGTFFKMLVVGFTLLVVPFYTDVSTQNRRQLLGFMKQVSQPILGTPKNNNIRAASPISGASSVSHAAILNALGLVVSFAAFVCFSLLFFRRSSAPALSSETTTIELVSPNLNATPSLAVYIALGLMVASVVNLSNTRSSDSGDGSLLPLSQGQQSSSSSGSGNASSSSEGLAGAIRFILAHKDTRNIFCFLAINFAFMFVELLYGWWNNSLGLITDAAHMLFDCSALVIGLYASYMAKWKPNQTFTYGYGRYEILSGFANGITLVFIACYVFLEAIGRLFEPPVVGHERMLLVSVSGFIVNVIGLIFFHDFHHHTHGPNCNHGDGDGGGLNTYGIFLHVLADALGSIGVIISTLLIKYFGMHLSDPLCSMFISVLILLSSYPLITQSASILLQKTPEGYEQVLQDCLEQVQAIDGVISASNAHFWVHSSQVLVGTLHVEIKDELATSASTKQVSISTNTAAAGPTSPTAGSSASASSSLTPAATLSAEQKILREITEIFLRNVGVTELTVQVATTMTSLSIMGGKSFANSVSQKRSLMSTGSASSTRLL